MTRYVDRPIPRSAVDPELAEVMGLAPPLFNGLRGLGYVSPNGVYGTIGTNGEVVYSGGILGLAFDVHMQIGQPVYGPLFPPPGAVQTAPSAYNPAQPFGPNFDSQGAALTAPPPAVAMRLTPWNPQITKDPAPPAPPAAAATTPPGELHPADSPAPDPNAGKQVVGKDTGDVFSFEHLPAALQELLKKAGELAPWYVWAGGGAAAVILLAAVMLHHQKRRGRR